MCCFIKSYCIRSERFPVSCICLLEKVLSCPSRKWCRGCSGWSVLDNSLFSHLLCTTASSFNRQSPCRSVFSVCWCHHLWCCTLSRVQTGGLCLPQLVISAFLGNAALLVCSFDAGLNLKARTGCLRGRLCSLSSTIWSWSQSLRSYSHSEADDLPTSRETGEQRNKLVEDKLFHPSLSISVDTLKSRR